MKVARVIAIACMAGITLSALAMLVFLVCDPCFPGEEERFVNTFKPVSWLGLVAVGFSFLSARSYSGSGLPVLMLRRSFYYLGLCMLLTTLAYVTSSILDRGPLYAVLVLGNLVISVLAIINVVQTGRGEMTSG